MKIYSPSQTKLFIECPRKWWISRKQGWTRKWVRKNDVAMMVGQAVGRVLADGHGTTSSLDSYTRAVDELFQAEMHNKQQAGYIIEDDVWAKYDTLKLQLSKVVQKYLTSPARIPDEWHIDGVELNVGDGIDHNAYIDVAAIEPDGSHIIWDFKCKMYLKAADQASELLGYRQDWQMMHYGYFYWKKFGTMPSRYYIGMPVLSPTPMFVGGNDAQGLGIFAYTQEALEAWYESACTWWSFMEQSEIAEWTPMSPNHTGRYGNCEFYDACFTYANNPDMMASQYIHIQPRS